MLTLVRLSVVGCLRLRANPQGLVGRSRELRVKNQGEQSTLVAQRGLRGATPDSRRLYLSLEAFGNNVLMGCV